MTDRPYYLIESDLILHGRRVTMIEDTAEVYSEAQLVNYILTTCNRVRRVLEIIPDDKSVRDVTEDIARAVLRKADADDFTLDVQEFCETQLGCRIVADALRELEAA